MNPSASLNADTTVGTCSICKGRVAVPSVWHGLNKPVPTCQNCGATKKNPFGPVIDMEKDDILDKILRQEPKWKLNGPCGDCKDKACGNVACPKLPKLTASETLGSVSQDGGHGFAQQKNKGGSHGF